MLRKPLSSISNLTVKIDKYIPISTAKSGIIFKTTRAVKKS
jgi:hypothetical protein